ncbi:hypothetical protein ABKN59_003118 [Abortiporus biennis]
MSSHSRLLVVAINALLIHLKSTPPNPPAHKVERVKFDGKNTRKEFLACFLLWSRPVYQIINIFLAVCEIHVLLRPPFLSPLGRILPSCSPDAIQRLGISTIFILGSILIMCGSSFRLWAFRKLGPFFTFEQSFKDDHKLVTDGPYAVVRHPGYIGAAMACSGAILNHVGSGSYWRECGVWKSHFIGPLGGFWILENLLLGIAVVGRVPCEDVAMQKQFKNDWEVWARSTPYKLIPFVY